MCVCSFFSTRQVDQMVKYKASKPSWMWSCRSWACGPLGPQWLIIYPLKDRYRWPSSSSSLLWSLLIIFLPFPFPLLGLSPNTPPFYLPSSFLFPGVLSTSHSPLPTSVCPPLPFLSISTFLLQSPLHIPSTKAAVHALKAILTPRGMCGKEVGSYLHVHRLYMNPSPHLGPVGHPKVRWGVGKPLPHLYYLLLSGEKIH